MASTLLKVYVGKTTTWIWNLYQKLEENQFVEVEEFAKMKDLIEPLLNQKKAFPKLFFLNMF